MLPDLVASMSLNSRLNFVELRWTPIFIMAVFTSPMSRDPDPSVSMLLKSFARKSFLAPISLNLDRITATTCDASVLNCRG